MGKYTKKAKRFFENTRERNGIKERKCSKCNKWKPETIEFFYMMNKSKPEKGFQAECIVCARERSKIRQRNKKEEYSEYWQQYYALKKKEYNDKRRIKRRNNEEMDNKLRRAREKKWMQEHPDKATKYNEKRQHKNHRITKNEWFSCKKYFNFECAYCGLPLDKHFRTYAGELQKIDFHKEHVNHNGTNDLTNCVSSCGSCNDQKWEFELDDWYNENNPNFTQERYDKIIQWLMEDCFEYIEEKKPNRFNNKINHNEFSVSCGKE